MSNLDKIFLLKPIDSVPYKDRVLSQSIRVVTNEEYEMSQLRHRGLHNRPFELVCVKVRAYKADHVIAKRRKIRN